MVKHCGLKPWEIERLDRWWIAHVYFAARDKWGNLKVSPKEPDGEKEPQDPKSQMWRFGKSVGWADWLIGWTWRKVTAERDKEKDKGKG